MKLQLEVGHKETQHILLVSITTTTTLILIVAIRISPFVSLAVFVILTNSPISIVLLRV